MLAVLACGGNIQRPLPHSANLYGWLSHDIQETYATRQADEGMMAVEAVFVVTVDQFNRRNNTMREPVTSF
jgi:hypothetical protein